MCVCTRKSNNWLCFLKGTIADYELDRFTLAPTHKSSSSSHTKEDDQNEQSFPRTASSILLLFQMFSRRWYIYVGFHRIFELPKPLEIRTFVLSFTVILLQYFIMVLLIFNNSSAYDSDYYDVGLVGLAGWYYHGWWHTLSWMSINIISSQVLPKNIKERRKSIRKQLL